MKTNTIHINNQYLRQGLVAEYAQDLANYESIEKLQQQQNYFLICESCFWMASTLSDLKSSNNSLPIHYTRCPLCNNKIDQFDIPSVLN